MASISVSEADFTAAAMGAHYAKADGDMEQARALDKLARKINAALSTAATQHFRWMGSGQRTKTRWQDMPSTIGDD